VAAAVPQPERGVVADQLSAEVALAFLAALASYYLVERPSPRPRQRIEGALVPGRAARAEPAHATAERPAAAS